MFLWKKMRSLGTADTSRSFSFIEPMKALPVEKVPEGDWLRFSV
jgi:hypothetical protein